MTPVLLALIAGPLMVGLVLAARYAESLAWRRSLVAFRLSLPSGMTPDDITRWLNTVAAATHAQRWALLPDPPIALEIAANAGIEHLLLVPAKMRATVLSGIRATLPGVRLDEAPDYLKYRPRFTVAAEAKLTNHRRQMAVDRAENTSTALLAALQPLYANEIVVVQWIIASAGTPARVPSAISTSMDSEAIRAARLKQTDTLLRVSLRVGVAAGSRARASAIFGRVWGQHRGLNAAGVLVVRRWWVWPRWAGIRMARLSTPVTSIWPIVLGSREAAGLLPLPVGLVALPGLTLGPARQLPPPREMPHRGTQLGLSNYPGMAKRRLCLSEHDRLQHVRVLGPTGVGKSTLLTNLILQDIAAGHAVVFIDLKGDACTDVLARVTGRRSDDLVVVDPAALSRPVGFNILRAGHDEQSRELVVDHVIHI